MTATLTTKLSVVDSVDLQLEAVGLPTYNELVFLILRVNKLAEASRSQNLVGRRTAGIMRPTLTAFQEASNELYTPIVIDLTYNAAHAAAYTRAMHQGIWYAIGHIYGDDGHSKAMVWLEEGHQAVSGYVDLKDVELWERPAEPN